jgi:hypothetical protein
VVYVWLFGTRNMQQVHTPPMADAQVQPWDEQGQQVCVAPNGATFAAFLDLQVHVLSDHATGVEA